MTTFPFKTDSMPMTHLVEDAALRAATQFDVKSRSTFTSVATAREPRMQNGECITPGELQLRLEGPEGGRFALGPYAERQLFRQVGIPKRYADKCLATPGMTRKLAEHVNRWLHREPEDVTHWYRCNRERSGELLRGTVRGIVSTHYRAFDNDELLATVAPLVEERGFLAQSMNVNDGRMTLKLVEPFATAVGVDPTSLDTSDMFCGLVLRNSWCCSCWGTSSLPGR